MSLMKELSEVKPKQNNEFQNKSKVFENAKKEVNSPEHISTRNEDKEGTFYNGVLYESRVISVNGKKVEGVFPEFESMFDIHLPKNLLKASDTEQFKYCSDKLKQKIESDSSFANNFTAEQLEQIKNGAPRIRGFTWHHNETPGVMQLVDSEKHQKCGHTGGRSIWGGGADYR